MGIFQLATKPAASFTLRTDLVSNFKTKRFMSNNETATAKQAYETPVLFVHGSVQDLTLGSGDAFAADTGASL